MDPAGFRHNPAGFPIYSAEILAGSAIIPQPTFFIQKDTHLITGALH